MLCIILPISWDYIVSPKLYNDEIVHLQRLHSDKQTEAQSVLRGQDLSGSYSVHTGNRTRNVLILTNIETYQRWYRFLEHLYENYFPANREIELAMDNIIRKRISIENTRSWVFFFNPIVLFNDISNRIAGNSRADYLRFLQEGRGIRNDFVSTGIREGWLLGYGFFAQRADETLLGSEVYWNERFRTDWEAAIQDMGAIIEGAEMFSFEIPIIRRYEQPNPTFGEIFSRIAMVLAMLVVSILGLWILTWERFMRYDVR